jgi:hypothetical protein
MLQNFSYSIARKMSGLKRKYDFEESENLESEASKSTSVSRKRRDNGQHEDAKDYFPQSKDGKFVITQDVFLIKLINTQIVIPPLWMEGILYFRKWQGSPIQTKSQTSRM